MRQSFRVLVFDCAVSLAAIFLMTAFANPVQSAALLYKSYGAEISSPGYLVSKRDSAQTLLSMVPLAPSLVRFLLEKGLDIIQIASPSTES